MSFRSYIVLSDHRPARLARRVYRAFTRFSLPAPRVITRPVLQLFLLARSIYGFLARVLFCEPLFKAYCARYGRNVRTGAHLHFVLGKGNIVVGDDVLLDGKSNFCFAARYSENPTLTIGDHCYIGHGCGFTVGKSITIGSHCYIAGDVRMFDTSGHPTDPAARRAGLPAPADKVRPIVIADNVWIGGNATVCPGVTIGEGSVIATYAVVTRDVPPYTLAAGNPARAVRSLAMEPPSSSPPCPPDRK